MYRFKPTQKFRVVIGPVSIFTTARTIRMGIGDFYQSNAAAQKALDALEHTKSGTGVADRAASGIGGTWEGLNVQVDIAEF